METNQNLELRLRIPDQKQWLPVIGVLKADKARKSNNPIVLTEDPLIGSIWFYYQMASYVIISAPLFYGYVKYLHPYLSNFADNIF